MSKKFDAVLFDIDGTLLDSEELIFQSFKHALLAHCSRDVSREEVFSFPSLKLAEYYKLLAPEFDAEKLSSLHKEFQNQHLHLSKLFPNVSETLDALHKRGIKRAAVSNRGGQGLVETLKLAEIFHHFSVIVGVDDVKNPKPHPEPILQALEKLQVSPGRAIMVGDSDVDIIAGREAGVHTIGVSYGFHGHRIQEHKPDFFVHDIKDILPIILD